MGYNRTYYGVITSDGNGFEIFTHKSSVDLTKEINTYWKLGSPVIMVMKNQDGEGRTMFKAKGDEIYLDKDANGNYKYHLGGKDIEKALTKAIGKAVSIVLHITSEGDINNGQAYKG